MRRFITIGVLLAVYCTVIIASEPTETPAKERGLTETNLTAVLLAEEGNKYYRGVAQRNFGGSVLGYVTPWNSHGYEVATKWRAKFTHVSPVWYQLKADNILIDAKTGVQLTGGQGVDQKWIAKVREPITKDPDCADGNSESKTCAADFDTPGVPPLIVPRVVAEVPPQVLVAMLQKPGPAIALMVDEVEKQGFDGLVFEAWLQWSGMGGFKDKGFTELAIAFVKKLAVNLKNKGKVLLLAVPPVVPSQPERPAADAAHLQRLAAELEGFSLMTYDYSSAGTGPNAPLPWQRKNVETLLAEPAGKGTTAVNPAQVLMGLNFYGYDFVKPHESTSASEARPIMGDAFLAVLRKNKPKLKWEKDNAEHKIKYKTGTIRHTVYYPTPASLAARISLATELGVGLSIWELGQGMDSFLDLL